MPSKSILRHAGGGEEGAVRTRENTRSISARGSPEEKIGGEGEGERSESGTREEPRRKSGGGSVRAGAL